MYYLVYGSMAGNDGERWARRLLCSLFGPVPFPNRPPQLQPYIGLRCVLAVTHPPIIGNTPLAAQGVCWRPQRPNLRQSGHKVGLLLHLPAEGGVAKSCHLCRCPSSCRLQ